MSFKRFYFVVLTFVLFAIGQVNASDKLYNFVVWASSGEQIKFALTENPKVSHDGVNLVVTTTETSVSYNAANVTKFTIEELSGVDKVEQNQAEIVNNGNAIYLSGFDMNAVVVISDISGKNVYSGNTDENGELTIDLSAYAAGIYVVSTNSINCKFIKK
ncbi:MAG: T9SS type A sorting domain-containing protein [Muribaculaceae bacterium]|nr:T9SS type A sorting domain-containing protein [Muribaculaceae bacterium]